ncbi:hypothetical protein RhiirA5_418726 [Rhizophagus irregularis]|uniref:Uncharacterized protein n=1 Tax=Rhizophagus irregularis TaxID=588596 RepID=A0A2N0PJQ0_9GLOM|nr:hypothetical protein RhiirA5_418726 [Rhizophagus irregularis]CAB5211702.1 unnamed protein product [Rhizophagus irregularis]
MISRKLLLLATVALFCMIFIGSTQTAPLNKREATAIADFNNGISGESTFIDVGSYRLTGSFTRGCEKDTNIQNYEFFVITKDRKKIDYTKDFIKSVKIFPAGGTSPFQKVYEGFHICDLVGGTFFVNHKGKKFSEALIKYA